MSKDGEDTNVCSDSPYDAYEHDLSSLEGVYAMYI